MCRIVHHQASSNEARVYTALGTPDATHWRGFNVARLCAQLYLSIFRGFRGALPDLYACVTSCRALGAVERAGLYKETPPKDGGVAINGSPIERGGDAVSRKHGYHCAYI